MSLIVKSLVEEKIVNEKGEIIGYIKFDPNDSNIMQKLSKILNDLTEALIKIKSLGEFPDISNIKFETDEDLIESQEKFHKISEGFNIENDVVESIFKDLKDVFGEESIDALTCKTKNVERLIPLIDFIQPYVEEARTKRVSKYINNTSNDVME